MTKLVGLEKGELEITHIIHSICASVIPPSLDSFSWWVSNTSSMSESTWRFAPSSFLFSLRSAKILPAMLSNHGRHALAWRWNPPISNHLKNGQISAGKTVPVSRRNASMKRRNSFASSPSSLLSCEKYRLLSIICEARFEVYIQSNVLISWGVSMGADFTISRDMDLNMNSISSARICTRLFSCSGAINSITNIFRSFRYMALLLWNTKPAGPKKMTYCSSNQYWTGI